MLQKLFWNSLGESIIGTINRYGRKFDVVVRNYSLIGYSNGERWLLTLMESEPLVFDVGFHDGQSAAEILHTRPKASVIAFDPARSSLREYEKNFNGDARVTFENIALSDAPGVCDFYDYENQCSSLARRKDLAGQAATIYEVAIQTVDGYCAERGIERINLLKVDAEGFDLNVLEGAHELLQKQGIDLFVFEFGGGWAAQKRYLWEADEYFRSLPYTLYRLFNGFLCPLIYDPKMDCCNTLSAMYAGVSHQRMSRGDIPVRHYRF
jgi:FkbM family methyltransferase